MKIVFLNIESNFLLFFFKGPNGNVFRIKPPMCITLDDINFTVEVFKAAFENHYDRLAKR